MEGKKRKWRGGGIILGRGHVPSQFLGATSSNIEFHVQSMIDYNILAQCYLHVVVNVCPIYIQGIWKQIHRISH